MASGTHKFTIPPQQVSYAVKDGLETLMTRLDGGAGRYRRDIIGATSTVNVSWLFTQSQYEYFRAFYRTTVKSGSLPFTIDLLMDTPQALTEHVAYFIPNKVTLSKNEGFSYTVKAQLEVAPVEENAALNDIIVLIYEEYGGDEQAFIDMINQLEQFPNFDLPALPVFVP